MKIVKYEEKYKEGVKKICFETANRSYQESPNDLYTLYADYYLEIEKETCFLAVNDYDEVVGYILCAPSAIKFRKEFKKSYYKKLSKPFKKEAKTNFLVSKVYGRKFNAHMHINITAHWRRMGVGKELLERLFKELKESSINGLYLGCSLSNTGARKFYERNGFKTLLSSQSGIVYGKEFK